MSKSILQEEKVCYLCGGQVGLEKHHILGGTANRKCSETWGVWVWLCGEKCHRGVDGAQYNKDLNLRLKQDGQRAFENLYGHDKWMEIFMKNYL